MNCESTCDLIDAQALIYDRKIEARHFDTIHKILQQVVQCCAARTDGLNLTIENLVMDYNGPYSMVQIIINNVAYSAEIYVA